MLQNIKERIENNTNIDYDGSQTFWKNMLREWTKERENWRRENAKFGKLYVCTYVEYNREKGLLRIWLHSTIFEMADSFFLFTHLLT